MLFHLIGPSLLVDNFGKIVQIIEGGGQYMTLQNGQFDNSIHSCFAPGLTLLIRHLMDELKEKSLPCIEKKVTGLSEYPDDCLHIKVSYFILEEGEYFLLQIGPAEEPDETKDMPVITGEPLDLRELKDNRIRILEKELGDSNWKPKLAVEESESRNEEMQSVNEELYTINAEFQNKILELTTANTDLERPVSHINFMNQYPDFIKDIKQVFEEKDIIEREITDSNNISWLVRIRPYYENNKKITGVLVTMFDITKRLESAKSELKRLTDTVPGGVLRLRYDDELVIDYANDSFYTLCGYTPPEIKEKFHNRFNRMITIEDWRSIRESSI